MEFDKDATNNHLSNRHTVRSGYTQTGWSEEPYTNKTQGEYELDEPVSDDWFVEKNSELFASK